MKINPCLKILPTLDERLPAPDRKGLVAGPPGAVRAKLSALLGMLLIFVFQVIWGCTMGPQQLVLKDSDRTFAAGSIISTASKLTIDFARLISDLNSVRVVYVGETHTDAQHHRIQLDIIQALFERDPDLVVGMEMFDKTYQEVLDQWSAGLLDEAEFLEKTHWYANWKFPFELYRPILEYLKSRHIPVIGLNLPFHIPPKIASGGIGSLSVHERQYLARRIDTSNPEHRKYLQEVFRHHSVKGRRKFDYFYEAQCAWEDTMAETVARHAKRSRMVVLVGNGHIVHKFGVPLRAFARSPDPFRTVYPIDADRTAELSFADYLWVTSPSEVGRSAGR